MKVSVFLLVLYTLSACLKKDVEEIKVTPEFVTKFPLGQKEFFESTNDSTSFLPNYFIFRNNKLFFEGVDKLMVYDLSKKENSNVSSINEALESHKNNNSFPYIQQLSVDNSSIYIVYNYMFFEFDQSENRLFKCNVNFPFKTGSSLFVKYKNDSYVNVDEGFLSCIEYNGKGVIKSTKDISKAKLGYGHYYVYEDTIYSTDGHYIIPNNLIENAKVYNTPVDEKLLKNGERYIDSYAMMGVSDKYTLWVSRDKSKINELILANRLTGKIEKKVIIDPVILNYTKIDESIIPDADAPEEERQYIRLCYGNGQYYMMFQSEKVIYIYRFKI